MSRLKNRINVSVMIVVGVAQTLFGSYLYVEMDTFLDNSLVANGMVIKLHRKRDGLIAPVVEFMDAKGGKHVFTSRSSSRPARYKLKESVEVVYIYDSSEAKLEAYIYSDINIFIRKYVLLIFGFTFIVLGILTGRLFWNRDSMYISFSFNKTNNFKK